MGGRYCRTSFGFVNPWRLYSLRVEIKGWAFRFERVGRLEKSLKKLNESFEYKGSSKRRLWSSRVSFVSIV